MFSEFYELSCKLNDEHISSYADLENYKNNGFLDSRVENEIDLQAFVSKIEDYLNFLFFDKSPHYKKQLMLHKNFDLSLICSSEYILCLYCDKLDAYNNFPLLLQTIAKKFNIEPYNHYSIDQYKTKILEFYKGVEYYDEKYQHIFHKIYLPYCMNTELYEKYESCGFSEETLFIWAEEQTNYLLSQTSPNYLEFVSKNYGDGFGYDLLCNNASNNREELIEVKSGRSDFFALSDNEFNVMMGTTLNDADYYIYRYYVDSSNNCLFSRLKFDLTNYCFYDIDYDTVYDIKQVEDVYAIVKREPVKELKLN